MGADHVRGFTPAEAADAIRYVEHARAKVVITV
jgi:hypothetical protein